MWVGLVVGYDCSYFVGWVELGQYQRRRQSTVTRGAMGSFGGGTWRARGARASKGSGGTAPSGVQGQ